MATTIVVGTSASPLFAERLGLSRAATPDEIAGSDMDVCLNKAGLPKGKGSVLEGEEIFTGTCAAWHGDFARRWAGGRFWPWGLGTL